MDPELKAYFTDYSSLDNEKHILVEYYFESLVPPEVAAAHLCQEMSTAQWHRVGVDEDFRPEFAAKVVDIFKMNLLDEPSSPFLARQMGWQGEKLFSCRVKIAFPTHNIGARIPNLLTAFCGEGVFHAPHICAIRLEDLTFPEEFLAEFEGPQFGVGGLRQILDVHDRPIFMGVIKPNIGLLPEPYGELAYQAWLGGLDIAMDDELIADSCWSSLEDRCHLLGQFRKKVELEINHPKIFQANITDEVENLIPNHDLAVRMGANALMLNSMTVGLSACRMLRSHSRVPLVSHFDLYGAMTQIPFQGIREQVFIKLQRLAGFDAILFAGFDSRMKSTHEDVLANVAACLSPMGNLKPSLPIPAGSQWAGSIAPLYEALGTIDFAVVPGRGVFEHPLGPHGGAFSLHQGWDAVKKGIPLDEYAQDHEELRLAIESR
ncbi:MAG: ribulose 1,5-bisphosphate carboxylase [Chloroflexi bacterium]|nr:ribulose 1,5-bisphosphate carboxylase [Chloroflexota bacterium]